MTVIVRFLILLSSSFVAVGGCIGDNGATKQAPNTPSLVVIERDHDRLLLDLAEVTTPHDPFSRPLDVVLSLGGAGFLHVRAHAPIETSHDDGAWCVLTLAIDDDEKRRVYLNEDLACRVSFTPDGRVCVDRAQLTTPRGKRFSPALFVDGCARLRRVHDDTSAE